MSRRLRKGDRFVWRTGDGDYTGVVIKRRGVDVHVEFDLEGVEALMHESNLERQEPTDD